MAKAFADNTARLAIVGDNPMLLAGQDPAKVARANKANSIAYQPALEKIVNFDINWNIVAYPEPVLGEAGLSRMTTRTSRSQSSPTRSSRPRASTRTTPSPHGQKHNATLREPHRMAERAALSARCITPGPAPT